MPQHRLLSVLLQWSEFDGVWEKDGGEGGGLDLSREVREEQMKGGSRLSGGGSGSPVERTIRSAKAGQTLCMCEGKKKSVERGKMRGNNADRKKKT